MHFTVILISSVLNCSPDTQIKQLGFSDLSIFVLFSFDSKSLLVTLDAPLSEIDIFNDAFARKSGRNLLFFEPIQFRFFVCERGVIIPSIFIAYSLCSCIARHCLMEFATPSGKSSQLQIDRNFTQK
jgi:hypothetical protein